MLAQVGLELSDCYSPSIVLACTTTPLYCHAMDASRQVSKASTLLSYIPSPTLLTLDIGQNNRDVSFGLCFPIFFSAGSGLILLLFLSRVLFTLTTKARCLLWPLLFPQSNPFFHAAMDLGLWSHTEWVLILVAHIFAEQSCGFCILNWENVKMTCYCLKLCFNSLLESDFQCCALIWEYFYPPPKSLYFSRYSCVSTSLFSV